MQFGIMAMQIGSLIPANLPPDQVLAHISSFDHARLVNELVDHGFHWIELGGDLSFFLPQSFSPDAIRRLLELKEARGVRYTVHLPLWSIEPSSPSRPVRTGSVQSLVEIIKATQTLDPEIYVLHATGALAAEFYRMRLPETGRLLLLRQFQGYARESLKMILEETRIPHRKLAIETIEFPFELTLELAEELDLSICFDTGHVLVGFSGPMDFFQALEASLPRLGEVHLHDGPWQGPERVIGYGKDHQPLGQGDLDVARFLDRLVDHRFSGPVIFELHVEEALRSLEVIRSMRPGLLNEQPHD